jgi:hypothetical protein
MGYEYINHGKATPYVPASMAFPKKKAKELKGMVEVPLSMAQQAIAKALSWDDWFALECAVKEGRTPSAPDEDVSEEERLKRWSTQFNAIHETLNLRLPDPEFIVAELGLTCSRATAKKRLSDIGPWGAFQEPPREIAPGIWLGQCAKFQCYRLSPERLAAMPPQWRLDTDWYMCDDHAWRVELAYPGAFDKDTHDQAVEQFAECQPFLYELEYGYSPYLDSVFIPTLANRAATARNQPESWFALSVFPDWTLAEDTIHSNRTIVSAIRGRDLLRLIEYKGDWAALGSTEVSWYVANSGELQERCRTPVPGLNPFNATATCLHGMLAYPHAPVCALPFKRHPFDGNELSFIACSSYEPLVGEIAEGVLTPLE